MTWCPVSDAHVDQPSCIMLVTRSPECLAPRKKVVSGAEISLMGAGVRSGVKCEPCIIRHLRGSEHRRGVSDQAALHNTINMSSPPVSPLSATL